MEEEKKDISEQQHQATNNSIEDGIQPQKISPFIDLMRSWDDEEFKLPDEIKNGIKNSLNWERPSRIQAMAIPYIITKDEDSNEYESLIA